MRSLVHIGGQSFGEGTNYLSDLATNSPPPITWSNSSLNFFSRRAWNKFHLHNQLVQMAQIME